MMHQVHLLRADARFFLLGLIAAVGCAATPARTSGDEAGRTDMSAEREATMQALQSELDRSMNRLELDGYDSPYFIAYRVEDSRNERVGAKYGALTEDDVSRSRTAYVEVRVGDYQFDNYANVDSETFRYSEYSPDQTVPLESNTDAIRGTLWLLTDATYKDALSNFLSKKGGAVYQTEDKTKVPSFSKEEPVVHRGEIGTLEFDRTRWKQTAKALSARIIADDDVLDGDVQVAAHHTVRYFVTSEGTTIVDDDVLYEIQVTAYARADDGMLLDNMRSFYARTPDGLPGDEELVAEVDEMVDELGALREAPALDPYTGPAILMPQAAGVLFHEAVGHRLEGERQRDDEEGRTFKGRIGKRVLPTFLSVYDDPTLDRAVQQQLNGHYAFDDEGVAAQRVTLVEDGVLRNFLKSRTPIEGSLESNGHGRAQGARKPMARMGNIVVEADAEHVVPYDALKARLLAEVKRQGKPFGLIIRDISGGSTNTSGYGYQAFKGASRLVYKVDPDTGEETLVRGVEIVGTPLTSINKIVAASDTADVFNGFCGAESGYVPVSTVAPALLTTELELQREQQSKERPPILPAPWAPAEVKQNETK